MTIDAISPSSPLKPRSGTQANTASRLLPVAGTIYVLAWIFGLLLGPKAPAQTAAENQIQAFYVHHSGGIVLQSLLVHGVAGIALAVMALGFALALRAWPAEALWIRITGLAAAAVSLVQVALALIAVATAHTVAPATSKALFSAINYADTVKLFLLASFAITITWAATRAGALPAWVRGLGYLLVPLLVVGGLAFVIDSSVLYLILEVSLVVLLIWAAAASWVIGRRPTT